MRPYNTKTVQYLSFNRHQSELLFKVISDRSEKSSTIVTTNLPFSQWTDLFENTTMVAALIDRLTLPKPCAGHELGLFPLEGNSPVYVLADWLNYS